MIVTQLGLVPVDKFGNYAYCLVKFLKTVHFLILLINLALIFLRTVHFSNKSILNYCSEVCLNILRIFNGLGWFTVTIMKHTCANTHLVSGEMYYAVAFLYQNGMGSLVMNVHVVYVFRIHIRISQKP